ncbi:hypothetical protein KM043_016563 [Ampulex compressa]|nr:hypothetical protein KM043_016563 [Ampulex compressa]
MASAAAARRLKIGSVEKNETRNRGLSSNSTGGVEERGGPLVYMGRLNASRFPLVRRRRRTKGFDDVWFVEGEGIKSVKGGRDEPEIVHGLNKKSVIVPRGTNGHLGRIAWHFVLVYGHYRSIDERYGPLMNPLVPRLF